MNSNALQFAVYIARERDRYIDDATKALKDAGRPDDVIRGAAFLARLRWNSTHPTYARRAEAA